MASSSTEANEDGYGYHLPFEPTPDYKFLCPICLGVINKTVQTIKCGHRFCFSCFTTYEKRLLNPFCPVDKNPLPNTPRYFFDVAFDREIRGLTLKCTNQDKGCPWMGELGTLEEHLSTCLKDKMACQLGCRLYIRASEVENHKLVCERRLDECDLCNVMVPVADMMDHRVLTCSKFPVGCASCGNLGILREEYDGHVNEGAGDCPATNVPCVFDPLGCKFRDRREDMQRHYDTSSIKHSSMMINMMVTIEKDLKLIREEVNFKHVEMLHVGQASENLQRDQYCIRNQLYTLNLRLSSLESVSHDGTLMWRTCIPYNETEVIAKSPHFFVGYPGYRFVLSLTIPPVNTSDFIRASLHLRHNNHSTLPYPIDGSIKLCLYHQVEGSTPTSSEERETDPSMPTYHKEDRKILRVVRNFNELNPSNKHGEDDKGRVDIDLISRNQLWIDSSQESGHVIVQVRVTQKI